MAEETHAPHRNVRVADGPWGLFEDAVGERNRSNWIKEFIGWVIDDPQLWHDARAIAAKRDEALKDVVLKALRSYVRRNRHLIDDSANGQTRSSSSDA